MNYRRNGLGGYEQVGNWSWEFDPPPYQFLAPRDAAPQPAPIMTRRGVGDYQRQAFVSPQVLKAPMQSAAVAIPDAWGRVQLPCPLVLTPQASGVGDCGCGCNGAGTCGDSHGLGLFESGLDYHNWGAMEWGAVAFGGYLALRVIGDLFAVGRATRSGYRSASAAVRRRRLKSQRKAELKAELASL